MMQAPSPIRLADISTTRPLACLFGEASVNASISTGKERDAESGNDYFGARYYASTMGRWMSPDPLPWPHWQSGSKEDQERFEGFIANPQNFNQYMYVRNNPLISVDPDGLDVYVVAYTVGNTVHGGDQQFKQAAETKADEIWNSKGFDATKDTVIVRGVKTKEDFKNLVNEANGLESKYGGVKSLALFAHGTGADGPLFHTADGKSTSFFNSSELSQLQVNWASGASATFYGCHTAEQFAQRFANAQGVYASGYVGGTRLSGTPGAVSKWYVLNPTNWRLYLLDSAGKGLEGKKPQ